MKPAIAAFMTVMVSLISARQMERIINGKNATQGQFPYQVSWQNCIDSIEMCLHFCGGSIFNETTIITAAHCCDSFGKPDEYNNIYHWSDSIIVAGVTNLQSKYESSFIQYKMIKSLAIHPFYRSINYQYNDICLLTLKSSLVFNQFVQPIDIDKKKPVAGTKCQLSGWGRQGTAADLLVKSNLQWTELMIKSDDECSKVFSDLLYKEEPYQNNTIKSTLYDHSTMICASAPETNACQGDSGGPLACDGKLTGVVSFGSKKDVCITGSTPVIYTKIHHYIDWIESNWVPETSLATQGQFPYQVSWCYNEKIKMEKIGDKITLCFHFCGGSILNRRTIITAAHCCAKVRSPNFKNQDKEILGLSDTKIVAGTLYGIFVEETNLQQALKVDRFIMHPDYDNITHQNNICLLNLVWPMDFNENVNRIDLDNKIPLVGTTCQVSGWAHRGDHAQDHPLNPEFWSTATAPKSAYPKCSWSGTKESNEEVNSNETPVFQGVEALCYELQWTEVMIKSEDDCSKAYENTDVKYDHFNMICAIAPETGVCKRDSGGPLTCNGKLTGVVSFGIGCTNASFPGVYTNIQHYIEWIESTMDPDTTTTIEKQPTTQNKTTISTGTGFIVTVEAFMVSLILYITSK